MVVPKTGVNMSQITIPKKTEVNKLKVKDLRELLNSIRDANDHSFNLTLNPRDGSDEEDGDSDNDNDPGVAAEPSLTDILRELRQFRKDMSGVSEFVKDTKDKQCKLEAECKYLRGEVEFLKKAVIQHQIYVESIESLRRNRNVIIYGLPEGETRINERHCTDDTSKVAAVWSALGAQVISEEVVRLGRNVPTNPGRPRPVRVALMNEEQRKSVLDRAKVLKDNADLRRVYVKRDAHPKLRRETARVMEVLKAEKEKEVNVGRNVTYDKDTRCVLVDGEIVDRFSPVFF